MTHRREYATIIHDAVPLKAVKEIAKPCELCTTRITKLHGKEPHMFSIVFYFDMVA